MNSNDSQKRSPMQILLALLAVLLMSVAVVPLTGCESSGPIEEVGEDIGDAVEEATD